MHFVRFYCINTFTCCLESWFPLFDSYIFGSFWDKFWRSWLRHWATSQKVAGSIPDGDIGVFHWHNPSGRTMAPGLTQRLTEMSTRNISWGVKAAGTTADNLNTFMCRLSWILGDSSSWNPQGLSRPVMGLLYPYLSQVPFLHRSVETAFTTWDNIKRTSECFAYIATCFPLTHCTNPKFIDRFKWHWTIQ